VGFFGITFVRMIIRVLCNFDPGTGNCRGRGTICYFLELVFTELKCICTGFDVCFQVVLCVNCGVRLVHFLTWRCYAASLVVFFWERWYAAFELDLFLAVLCFF